MGFFRYAIILKIRGFLTWTWPRNNDLVIIYSNIFHYFMPHSCELKVHLQNQGNAICGTQQTVGFTKHSDKLIAIS